MVKLIQILMPNATPGVIIEDGFITRTAPMLRKFKGQSEGNIRKWVEKNNWKINEMEIPEDEDVKYTV
jgi:hypothetical protein